MKNVRNTPSLRNDLILDSIEPTGRFLDYILPENYFTVFQLLNMLKTCKNYCRVVNETQMDVE